MLAQHLICQSISCLRMHPPPTNIYSQFWCIFLLKSLNNICTILQDNIQKKEKLKNINDILVYSHWVLNAIWKCLQLEHSNYSDKINKLFRLDKYQPITTIVDTTVKMPEILLTMSCIYIVMIFNASNLTHYNKRL